MPQKGPDYERSLCHRLSKWWSRNETSSIFWRTSNSGGRATTRRKTGKATAGQHGDLCAIDPDGQPFIDLITLEIKRGYDSLSVWDMVDTDRKPPRNGKGKKPPPSYREWLNKLVNLAGDVGTPYWALIHKRNYREAIILFPQTLLHDLLDAKVSNWCAIIPFAHVRMTIEGNNVDTIAVRLESFLECVTSDQIIEVAKKRCRRETKAGV